MSNNTLRRVLGVRTIPLLNTKVAYGDIIQDSAFAGTNKLLSSVAILALNDATEADYIAKIGALKGATAEEYSTLKKIEDIIKADRTAQNNLNTTLQDGIETNEAGIVSNAGAINTEAQTRASEDTLLRNRIVAIESEGTTGSSFRGNVNNEAGLDALTESSLRAGYSFYNIENGDVYRAIEDANAGDYKPASFTTFSFQRIAEFKDLAGLVTAERIAREGADTTLTNNLATEKTAREGADTTLTNNLATEKTARENADILLAGNIDNTNALITALKADKNTANSILSLIDRLTLKTKVEADLTITGDNLTLTKKPTLDGIVHGEVFIYVTIGSDVESIAIPVLSVAGAVVTLATNTINEFDGQTAKIHYFYRDGEQ